MKPNAWWTGAVLGAAMTAICCSTWPAGAADELEVATVGNANPIAWPGLIAQREGMFAAEGLDVKVLYVQSSSQLIQLMAAGSVKVGFSIGLVDPIRAVHQGAPIALIRLEGQSSPFALVGKPTIKRLADLKGKTIMIGGAKDITRFYLERMLAPVGLKTGDYDLVYAGATPARYAALKSGAVDAVMLFPPFNLFALADGFSDLGLVVDHAPNLPFSGTAVNRTWADANKPIAERYLRAINRAIEFFNADANRDKAVGVLVEAMKGKPEDLGKTYDFFRRINFYAASSQVSRVKLNEIAAMLKADGDLPQDFDVNKLVLPGISQLTD